MESWYFGIPSPLVVSCLVVLILLIAVALGWWLRRG